MQSYNCRYKLRNNFAVLSPKKRRSHIKTRRPRHYSALCHGRFFMPAANHTQMINNLHTKTALAKQEHA